MFAALESSKSVVLAVSGGPDSTALMFLAARWRAARPKGPRLIAVTVDHGLRPTSAREAATVKRLAARLRLAHRTARWTGRKPSTGVQQAAREARYSLLVAAARREGARHILTAHTLEDQAETVLFRLARGSGLAGLAGMARSTALDDRLTLIRPLLEISKARLLATLEAADIVYIDDPSNRDPRFARTRIRQLAPALAREGLDAARLAVLARRLGRAEQALVRATDQALGELSRRGSGGRQILLDRRSFAQLPAEIALRVLGRAVAGTGREGPVELGKLERLLAVVLRSARLRRTLAGALITVDREKIVVEAAPPRRIAADPAGRARSAKTRHGGPIKASFTAAG